MVKVVIPIYRERLNEFELKSIRQNVRILDRYPIFFLLPEGLHVPEELAACRAEPVYVGQEWLGDKEGIAGYNSMLLSGRFYDLFADAEYLLICQPDAWIFRDELSSWCERGYDYVGAPWLKSPLYDRALVQLYLAFRRKLFGRGDRILPQHLFNRVGNGGLSLRKIESHRAVCMHHADQIARFNAKRHHLYNEDVFWSLVPQDFIYPTVDEALHFSFDLNPDRCYAKTNGALPFGCHGWFKGDNYRFWKMFID